MAKRVRTDTTVATKKRGFGNSNAGRVKGTPNKTTALLKDAILMAAQIVGEDGEGKDGLVGYLTKCAKDHPKQYLNMLGRVLPYHVTTDRDEFTERVLAELRDTAREERDRDGRSYH